MEGQSSLSGSEKISNALIRAKHIGYAKNFYHIDCLMIGTCPYRSEIKRKLLLFQKSHHVLAF